MGTIQLLAFCWRHTRQFATTDAPPGAAEVRRDKLDDIFSLLIRERASWICENCKLSCEHQKGYLDCAHIQGRAHRSTRWHPEGALALCKSCHRHFTDRPLDWARFVDAKIGREKAEFVRKLSNRIAGLKKFQKEEIYKAMKCEYAAMMGQRCAGSTGRIEFMSPYPKPIERAA